MSANPAARWNCGPEHAPGVLEIDLGALAWNYRYLADLAAPANAAAVVKADGYGLGVGPVATTLAAAGCQVFFTAHLDEAIALRAILPDQTIEIGVLNGLVPNTEALYAAHSLFPVLNDLGQIEVWRRWTRKQGETDSTSHAALQIDSGMSRLGVPADELETLLAEPERLDGVNLRFLMSHMACADTPSHPLNAQQLALFGRARAALPPVEAMLAASSAALLGPDWRFDYIRPGVALFGGRPEKGRPNPMRPVVALRARILQIQNVAPGQTIGYGATYEAKSPAVVATLGVGYADGYLRSLSNSATAILRGRRIKVVGRISMDLSSFDVSAVPDAQVGDMVSLLNAEHTIDDLADQAGTIGYEILTGLGRRYRRVYRG